MVKKKVDGKDAQLYTARVDRMKEFTYGGVLVGRIEFTIYSGKIKDAYLLACEKGIEVFGKDYIKSEFSVVQVRPAPMNRVER